MHSGRNLPTFWRTLIASISYTSWMEAVALFKMSVNFINFHQTTWCYSHRRQYYLRYYIWGLIKAYLRTVLGKSRDHQKQYVWVLGHAPCSSYTRQWIPSTTNSLWYCWNHFNVAAALTSSSDLNLQPFMVFLKETNNRSKRWKARLYGGCYIIFQCRPHEDGCFCDDILHEHAATVFLHGCIKALKCYITGVCAYGYFRVLEC